MEERHRRAIQQNFTSLVEQTDLDMMVSALYERGVFSEQMIEQYKDVSKDVRYRKRLLYMDVTRRGPQAFGHLLDALFEAGHWNLVRDLDPHSALHSRPQTTRRPLPDTSSHSSENNFVSISAQKKKTKSVPEPAKSPRRHTPATSSPGPDEAEDTAEIPQIDVVKSTKFYEDGHDIKLYRTRGRNRGVLVVFTYIEFLHNTASYRRGADVDCQRLKYLFNELGFKVLSYINLTESETWNTLHSLKEVVAGVDCVFIVVSSHGYPSSHGSDIDIRCHDGRFISVFEIVNHFNNERFPALRGIPKVFIFQLCRGNNESFLYGGAESDGTAGGAAGGAGGGAGPPRLLPPESPGGGRALDRVTSDILVAHSTIPGNVSFRDRRDGSWYIQALCSVFAARAHDCHVEKLFTLVDKELHKNFHVQTSAVEKWGFNCRLYLHPGLVETDGAGEP
ncbi:caspase Nc [Danaus plexippus plexippus]|uniref:Caspase Nc n=2 Tax=Danaus plexippus TaxID=13037 RepID=A0A212FNV6_DANPL|nr:caspase Nc [Danaus plexippus plexippus]